MGRRSSADCVVPDYYAVLGVNPRDSAAEIRRAHRRLVRQYHPDANPTDPQAAEKFARVQAAYDVLSDPEQRARYDQSRNVALSSLAFHTDPDERDPSSDYEKENEQLREELSRSSRHIGIILILIGLALVVGTVVISSAYSGGQVVTSLLVGIGLIYFGVRNLRGQREHGEDWPA